MACKNYERLSSHEPEVFITVQTVVYSGAWSNKELWWQLAKQSLVLQTGRPCKVDLMRLFTWNIINFVPLLKTLQALIDQCSVKSSVAQPSTRRHCLSPQLLKYGWGEHEKTHRIFCFTLFLFWKKQTILDLLVLHKM